MDINTMDAHAKRGAAKQPVAEILDGLRVLVGALASASRNSERKHGMSGAQLFVLQKLAEGGELSVNELAERTHTHQSTVSTVVSKLVTKGLVRRRRSDSDARVQLLTLSATGRQKLQRKTDTIQDRLIRSIESLPAAERRELSRLLTTVIHEAGLDTSHPALFFESSRPAKRKEAA
jgi:DNA-binding MarR family transcriptional regulator